MIPLWPTKHEWTNKEKCYSHVIKIRKGCGLIDSAKKKKEKLN